MTPTHPLYQMLDSILVRVGRSTMDERLESFSSFDERVLRGRRALAGEDIYLGPKRPTYRSEQYQYLTLLVMLFSDESRYEMGTDPEVYLSKEQHRHQHPTLTTSPSSHCLLDY